MRTFRIKQVKDGQDEDELSAPDAPEGAANRRLRSPEDRSDERSESSANRGTVFMPAGETCNPAHRPGKIPLRSVRGTRTERKRPCIIGDAYRPEKAAERIATTQPYKIKRDGIHFSRIIAGEIPSYKVAEDENYYAFLDINPLTKGHTLVVPKQEVDYIFDLDDRTLAGMMVFAKQVAARIKREIACARVAVVVLGMEVPHAHIHLIPIQSENDVDFHREKLRLTPEEFREIAEKLAR